MYISATHTSGRSIKNTMGVVMNHQVGMGLIKVDLAGLVSGMETQQ